MVFCPFFTSGSQLLAVSVFGLQHGFWCIVPYLLPPPPLLQCIGIEVLVSFFMAVLLQSMVLILIAAPGQAWTLG